MQFVTTAGVSGLILSVESNQNVESKMKNVESKPRNCGVQNWLALQELVPSYTEQPVFCTFAWKYHRYANSILDLKLLHGYPTRADDKSAPIFTDAFPEADVANRNPNQTPKCSKILNMTRQ